MKKTIMILGGDGFCGWPTSLYLSAQGYNVVIVDNLSRRKIDIDLGTQSLTPIKCINERINTWKSISNNEIEFINTDVTSDSFYEILLKYKPETIVHFAEQRAAPFSMKNLRTKRYTIQNNIVGTHNVLACIAESGLDIHLVHLGTMGVYGYGTPGAPLPEGYAKATIGKSEVEIVYPPNPGSVYHMSKVQDHVMFQYYAKNDGLRITDLHQGIVWGTQTKETALHEDLINRFDYDSDYGTVLNRFLVQAAAEYPLTVYGTGGQTRAFININDTVKCIDLAIQTPPNRNERPLVYNQMTETHRVIDIAKMISDLTKVKIDYLTNPRKESPENNLLVVNDNFKKLGLNPITLQKGLAKEIMNISKKYISRFNPSHIPPTSFWSKDKK